LDIHVANIDPSEALVHAKSITMRLTDSIQPTLIMETGAFDNQGVFIPMANRVT